MQFEGKQKTDGNHGTKSRDTSFSDNYLNAFKGMFNDENVHDNQELSEFSF